MESRRRMMMSAGGGGEKIVNTIRLVYDRMIGNNLMYFLTADYPVNSEITATIWFYDTEADGEYSNTAVLTQGAYKSLVVIYRFSEITWVDITPTQDDKYIYEYSSL